MSKMEAPSSFTIVPQSFEQLVGLIKGKMDNQRFLDWLQRQAAIRGQSPYKYSSVTNCLLSQYFRDGIELASTPYRIAVSPRHIAICGVGHGVVEENLPKGWNKIALSSDSSMNRTFSTAYMAARKILNAGPQYGPVPGGIFARFFRRIFS